MRVVQLVVIATSIVAAACASPTAPELPAGAIQVNGTVRYLALEGGFGAVRGDDGVTYDPMNGLAPAFQRDNLRVTMVAKVRSDLGGIHWSVPSSKCCLFKPVRFLRSPPSLVGQSGT
jgi:hypothetical protein